METKLLTEADLELIDVMTPDERALFFRNRGLIAPEPVDPLDAEVDRIFDAWPQDEGARWLARTALKRGMEMRASLTREMVRELARKAFVPCTRMISQSDFYADATDDDKENLAGFVDRLHAALTKEQS